MFKSKHQLTVSSHVGHPYEEQISDLYSKARAAIIMGLLERLIRDEESEITSRLCLLFEKEKWNKIKDIKGFDKNEREISDVLVASTRNLLLFQQLYSYFDNISGLLTSSYFTQKALEGIPDEAISLMLEEFLDVFMEEEVIKHSDNENNPIVKAIEEAETLEQDSSSSSSDQYLPDSVDQEIKRIQIEKQSQFPMEGFQANQQSPTKENRTVNAEIRNYIHPILKNLYGRVGSDLTQEYIEGLKNDINIRAYINRPPYKLALRIRNILVFSRSSFNVPFSKKGISEILKSFQRTFKEQLETRIFLKVIKNNIELEPQKNNLKQSIHRIVCRIYYEMTAEPTPSSIPIPEGMEVNSPEFAKFMSGSLSAKSKHLLTDYSEISLKEASISPEELFGNVIQILKDNTDPADVRGKLVSDLYIFAERTISNKKIEISKENFERKFFWQNSSNVLLEISRRLLSFNTLEKEEFQAISLDILSEECFSEGFKELLRQNLTLNYHWEIYLPVKGICVNEKSIQSFVHDFAPCLSELHEIKFLSPEILKTVSLEATSNIEGVPIVFTYKNATACAFFKKVESGDAYQALKIAINQLSETMEVQWYLTPYGHQYKIEPLLENSELTAFCKKVFTSSSLPSVWHISLLTYKRNGVIPYELKRDTVKYFSVPARQAKILTQRASISDPLGILSSNILHCIKLFRKGYFSEDLAERFRLYWTIFDILFSTETASSTTTKAIVPYRVSLFRLGVNKFINSGFSIQYEQARLWMREDIEDLYTYVRNPLIHDGVENTVAYERLMKRLEDIVSSILKELTLITIYKTYPDIFLNKGMEGIIHFLETYQPAQEYISVE